MKLARLTVKPGTPAVSPGGTGEFTRHDIHDESGKHVGWVRVQVRDGGSHLHVDGVRVGEAEGVAGVGEDGLRDVVHGLRAHYPDIKSGSYRGVRSGQPLRYSRPVKLAAIEPPGAPGSSVILKVPAPKAAPAPAAATPAPERPIKQETPPSAPAKSPVWILPQ